MLPIIPMCSSVPETLPIWTFSPKSFFIFFLMNSPAMAFGMKSLSASSSEKSMMIVAIVASMFSTMLVSPNCRSMTRMVSV